MTGRLGTQIGLIRQATVLKYYDDGTILVGLDEAGFQQTPTQFRVSIPMAWTGQEGEFLGGYPKRGSSVYVSQGQGGQWYVHGYAPSNNVFNNSSTLSSSSVQANWMGAFRPGRILGQVKKGNRFFLDPDVGFQVGSADRFLHINPNRNIISHNFDSDLSFTEASRSINSVIKRDLNENANRNVLGSTLDAQAYDNGLYTIGLDPSSLTSPTTTGTNIRNPPLVEMRELVYEFANSYNYTYDEDESNRYSDPKNAVPNLKVSRRNMRTDALSLSLEAPNQLVEKIVGTAVDIFGNVLDLNRSILPVGKIDELTFRKNSDKSDAFKKISAQLRKSIAFHWELNSKKGTSDPDELIRPDVNSTQDYARNEGKTFIDIDKEGQFKINIAASSEIGNLPVLTRTTNYSNLLSKSDSSVSPNAYVRNQSNQDVFLKNFAGKASIKISSGDHDLDGYAAPIDYLTDSPIKYGTAYHDITKTCSEFQTSANYLAAGMKLVDFDSIHHLNSDDKPFDKIVSDTITVSGPNANAGGRSGSINMDGFLMLNIGANTADRQSLWIDTAGGVIANYGRDKQGISYAGNFDGSVLLQVGGPGIGNTFDSRFSNQNDAYVNGKFELRILINGQILLIRASETGIDLVSPGQITLSCQQDMIFKTNSSMKFSAENIIMHADTTKRIINKFPANTI